MSLLCLGARSFLTFVLLLSWCKWARLSPISSGRMNLHCARVFKGATCLLGGGRFSWRALLASNSEEKKSRVASWGRGGGGSLHSPPSECRRWYVSSWAPLAESFSSSWPALGTRDSADHCLACQCAVSSGGVLCMTRPSWHYKAFLLRVCESMAQMPLLCHNSDGNHKVKCTNCKPQAMWGPSVFTRPLRAQNFSRFSTLSDLLLARAFKYAYTAPHLMHLVRVSIDALHLTLAWYWWAAAFVFYHIKKPRKALWPWRGINTTSYLLCIINLGRYRRTLQAFFKIALFIQRAFGLHSAVAGSKFLGAREIANSGASKKTCAEV